LTKWLWLSGLIVLADQASKMIIESQFQFAQRLKVLPVFDLTLLYNKGAAFSFLAASDGWQRWLFTAIGIIASFIILALMRKHQAQPRFMCALSLILGGALGNVIDRVWHGQVIDFLLFYWRDWYYPAFNVADMAITCGALLLVLDEILRGLNARSAK
jgi:signal peptidase II